MSSVKEQAQTRFGQFAQAYIISERHARGPELTRMLELAQPQADWLALDVATGGGHTARRFAPHVRQVVAADIALPMLQAARAANLSSNASVVGEGLRPSPTQTERINYVVSDAENLSFADGLFDLATCRIAPHHFPDVFRFVQESVRVLRPGGLLLVQDLTVPDDERAARYVDSFYRLRDPSHHRCYAPYEWRGIFLDAGLDVEHLEALEHRIMLLPWAEQQACSTAVIERLQILLKQAPQAVAEHLRPFAVGTSDASYTQTHVMLLGRKHNADT
jgi:ubiquinone/menaquinone biosynthesis C-methylase UbiE